MVVALVDACICCCDIGLGRGLDGGGGGGLQLSGCHANRLDYMARVLPIADSRSRDGFLYRPARSTPTRLQYLPQGL